MCCDKRCEIFHKNLSFYENDIGKKTFKIRANKYILFGDLKVLASESN
jgi:hypothetical protein